MTGFSAPNYTQIPNDLFDMIVDMTGAELKVVLHAARQTFGYHRDRDRISLSQFEAATGLARQSVVNGLNAAIRRGVLKQAGTDADGVNIYRIVVSAPESKNKTTGSPKTRPEVVQKLDTQKKGKETGKKDDDDDGARAREGLQASTSEPEPDAPNIFSLYHTTFGRLVSNPLLADDLKDMQAEYAWPDIVDAFKAAALANATNHKYARRCLENWRLHGRDKPPSDRPATPKGTGPVPRPSKPNSRVSPLPPLAQNAPPPPWLKAGAS